MRLLVSLLAVVMNIMPLPAQLGKCIKGNCVNGYGELVLPSGDEYKGDFLQGKFHGQGIMYFKSGDKYLGAWASHRREGRGRYVFADGSEYLGQFIQDRFHGKGVMTSAVGDRYEGDFRDGLFDGQGTMHYADGSTFVGQWQQGKRNGEGVMSLRNGERLTGTWKNDQYQAAWGSVLFPGDTVSLRDCNTNYCLTGLGKYTYKNGNKFVGDFRDGKPEGSGIVYYTNGDRYEGDWKKDAPNGKGVMHYTDGRVVGAVWESGAPLKELFSDRTLTPSERSTVIVDYDKAVKIWAVVIGAARYTHMPILRYTDDDAYQIFAFLKSPEGGALPDNQIRLLIDEDATRSNILYALRTTFARADDNDVVLFYFSGHGIEGAFLPIDYDGVHNKLLHSEVRDLLASTRAKHKIVVADACHSGGLLALKTPLHLQVQKLYQAFEESKGGTALLMSSKSEEYSLEDGGLRSGVFSHFLIRGLKGEADQNGDKIVGIQELYNYVYRQVRKYTASVQSPTLSGVFDPNMPISVVR